jgi:16S rRNA (uracil1498-N3)-methyltransferase
MDGNVPGQMTTSIRLHVASPLSPGAEVAATQAQAHYLGAVMRREAGDAVRLFNGADGEWQARIASLGRKREGAMFVAERLLRPQEDEPDIWLAFAPLKRDTTDLVVQKATELGAARLLPVLTARTNAARVNLERLAAIAAEAAEQCERLTVPLIDPPRTLDALLDQWPAQRRLVVAAERVDAPMVPAMPGPAGLLVGPEGGFTPLELDVISRRPFVLPATLGQRILRAETAAIVGLALMQAHTGGQD